MLDDTLALHHAKHWLGKLHGVHKQYTSLEIKTMKSCIREIPSIHAIVASEMPGTRGIETKVLACYNSSEIYLGAASQKRDDMCPYQIR